MKATILFAPPSEKYDLPWSTEKLNEPLQSGPAVLAAYLKEQMPKLDVQCIGSQVVTPEDFNKEDLEKWVRYRTIDEFIGLCRDSDVVGMSVLLSNISSSLHIASRLKQDNPDKKIVLGGQGVSNIKTAELILRNGSSIDYIVQGDGEDALLGIIRGDKKEDIPNIFFRHGNNISRTKRRAFNLNNRVIFDYTSTPDHEDVLRAYDSRTEIFRELRKDFGNFIGRVGVQLTSGCEKARQKGPCSYCTSQSADVQEMNPETFWKQIKHLYNTHGITEYFIVDNILAIPEKVDRLADARYRFSLPDSIQFRAYGYVPYCIGKKGDRMIRRLREIGVSNLFLGIESFDKAVNEKSNKPGFDFKDVYKIVENVTEEGIDLFLPIMIGMPGESEQSIKYNIQCLDILLDSFGRHQYGQGGLVRVDLSEAMPLRGTPWFSRLARDKEVLSFYKKHTCRDLLHDLDPDYDVLRIASSQYFHPTGLEINSLDRAFGELQNICLKYIRPEQIGGFQPNRNEGSFQNESCFD